MTPIVSNLPLRTGLSYEVVEWMPVDAACDHTVLLLHGFLDLAWGWLPVVETGLLDRYHLLAPSFRGHGRSDWVGAGGAYYFLDYVSDLASLVPDRARTRLSIVGHSMGGMVASLFAGTFPERANKLALLEGLAVPEYKTGPVRLRDSVKGRAEANARRGTQAQPGSRRFRTLEEAAARMRHHDRSLDPALALRLAEEGCRQLTSGEWVFRHDPLLGPRSPIGFEVETARRFWSEVRCDVLHVEGSTSELQLAGDDRARRLECFSNARSLRNATIPDAGHMMLRHKPRETAQLLVDFIGI